MDKLFDRQRKTNGLNMQDKDIVESISTFYPILILRAFNNDYASIAALETIAKTLKDVYRFFEPAYFTGNFYLCKNFDNQLCFPEQNGFNLYDKNVLLNRTTGTVIIQVRDDNSLFMWENEDPNTLANNNRILTYHYTNNHDEFLANGQALDATTLPIGSQYAPQFFNLLQALNSYKVERVLQSSCNIFLRSWNEDNRLFFKSEGSGNNAPEKHMQESLHDYLRTQDSLRGISMEVLREVNVNVNQPKPVDIRVQWKEANRLALIEIKWIGAVKSTKEDAAIRRLGNPRVNEGYSQLKGYYDSAKQDLPNTIIKPHLVVLDGRRNNLADDATTISYADGMHFQNIEVVIDADKKYYESIPGFELPIRMFAAPKCV